MNRATQAEGLGGAIERMIADRVAEAVAEEREACAKLAETPLCASDIDDYVVPTQEAIARLIRARK